MSVLTKMAHFYISVYILSRFNLIRIERISLILIKLVKIKIEPLEKTPRMALYLVLNGGVNRTRICDLFDVNYNLLL